MSTTIGIVIFDDAEELDFVGPWEVFTMAAMGRDDLHVLTIAEAEGPVHCAKGLRVLPHRSFSDAPPLDVVLVPGGQGTRREAEILLELGHERPADGGAERHVRIRHEFVQRRQQHDADDYRPCPAHQHHQHAHARKVR